MEFTCTWCNETKSEEAFVRRDTKQPYSVKNIRCCKACNTAKNRDRYKVPEIKEKQIEANAKWRAENSEKMQAYTKEFREQNPRNGQAKDKVNYMLRKGYWTRQPCEVCGKTEGVEAHHDSYAVAHHLTVRWLCKEHHEKWHQVLDPIKVPILAASEWAVSAANREIIALQDTVVAARKRIKVLQQDMDGLDFDAWVQVQKAAESLFRQTFKK